MRRLSVRVCILLFFIAVMVMIAFPYVRAQQLEGAGVRLPDAITRDNMLQHCERLISTHSGPDAQGAGGNSRVVGTVDLSVPPNHRVVARLYLVNSRTHREVGHATGSDRQSRRRHTSPRHRSVAFALIDFNAPFKAKVPLRTTTLYRKGLPQGSYSFGDPYEPFTATHSHTFTGRIRPNQTYLFYVEGDREFVARPSMSLDEFTAGNDGMFLVLTLTVSS